MTEGKKIITTAPYLHLAAKDSTLSYHWQDVRYILVRHREIKEGTIQRSSYCTPRHRRRRGKHDPNIIGNVANSTVASTAKTQNENLFTLDQNICLFFKTRFSKEKASLWRDNSVFGLICGWILTADPVWGYQMNSQTFGAHAIYCLKFHNTTGYRTNNSIYKVRKTKVSLGPIEFVLLGNSTWCKVI